MKFYLVGGQIKFLTHKVEWQERGITTTRELYDVERKDAVVSNLAEREIEYTVTEYEQPSAELLAKCEGKTFNTYEDALAFVETGTMPKTELQILQETVDALVLASLEV